MSAILDRARVLAALAVFYYHIGLNLGLPLSDLGEYAVTAFLMMAMVSAVAFSLPKGPAALRPAPYLAARLGRLMPLYLFVNVVVYALSFVVPSQLGRPFTVGELSLSCTGLSQYFGTRYLSLVFWFIPFIVQVYLLIAFGHPYIERLRGWWWVLVAFALFWLEILVLRNLRTDPNWILRDWSPLLRPVELLLGVQGGLWLTGRLSVRAFAGRVGLAVGLAGVLVLGAARDPRLAYAYTMPLKGLLVTVAILGAAWVLAAGWRNTVPARSYWRRLGRATYPFYLIHGLAIMFLFHRFGRAPLVWLGYLAFCTAAALVLDAMFSAPKRSVTV